MAKYEAVHSVYEPQKKGRPRLRRPGTLVEVSGDDAERLLELGAVRQPNEGSEENDATAAEEVELPVRPANSATKAEWRTYLEALSAVTSSEMEPLVIPDDATRDQMIQIGDQRVAEWNE